jgi:hypothetical protein
MLKYLLLLLLFLFTSCSTIHVDYIGETFPPTSKAKIYFSEQDIHKPYTVIGKAIVRASTSFSTAEIQKKLKYAADRKGADAVVILSFKEVPEGMYNYMNNSMTLDGMYGSSMDNTSPNNMGPYWNDMFFPDAYGQQSMEYYYDYLIKSLFIRFKASPRVGN